MLRSTVRYMGTPVSSSIYLSPARPVFIGVVPTHTIISHLSCLRVPWLKAIWNLSHPNPYIMTRRANTVSR